LSDMFVQPKLELAKHVHPIILMPSAVDADECGHHTNNSFRQSICSWIVTGGHVEFDAQDFTDEFVKIRGEFGITITHDRSWETMHFEHVVHEIVHGLLCRVRRAARYQPDPT